jgi:hypothetical protein
MEEKNKDDATEELESGVERLLGRFQPGGDRGPIEDRQEWEKLVASKPPEERELLDQLARFSDLWRYLQEHKQNLGQEIVDRIRELNKLQLADRIVEIKAINQKLMERVGDAGDGAQLRH